MRYFFNISSVCDIYRKKNCLLFIAKYRNFDNFRPFAIFCDIILSQNIATKNDVSQNIEMHFDNFLRYFAINIGIESTLSIKLCEVSQSQKSSIEIRKNYQKIYRNVELKISIIMSTVIDIFFTLSIPK